MKNRILVFAIMLVVIGTPLILVYLLDKEIFSFASGQVDSWIMFWGSYTGAIIGASAVYFVARFQLQKQHEKQLKAIEVENKHNEKREMEQFLITTKLDKYEKTIEVCERLSNLLMKISNEFVMYVTYTDIINNQEDPSKEDELKEKIYIIENGHRSHHETITYNISKLNVLTNYSLEIEEECGAIIRNFYEIWDEAKKCYLSKEVYKKYLNPNEKFLLNRSEETLLTLTTLIHHFNDKISNKLVEIEKKIRI